MLAGPGEGERNTKKEAGMRAKAGEILSEREKRRETHSAGEGWQAEESAGEEEKEGEEIDMETGE